MHLVEWSKIFCFDSSLNDKNWLLSSAVETDDDDNVKSNLRINDNFDIENIKIWPELDKI